MKPTHLKRLLKAAKSCQKVAPGPWSSDDGNIFCIEATRQREARSMARRRGERPPSRDGWDGFVASTGQSYDHFEDVERFIELADPATIIALIEELERLRASSGSCPAP